MNRTKDFKWANERKKQGEVRWIIVSWLWHTYYYMYVCKLWLFKKNVVVQLINDTVKMTMGKSRFF